MAIFCCQGQFCVVGAALVILPEVLYGLSLRDDASGEPSFIFQCGRLRLVQHHCSSIDNRAAAP
jgi:hypothetical protein